MNIDDCRAEKKKRRRQKAQAESRKDGKEASHDSNATVTVIDEEGPVHRPVAPGVVILKTDQHIAAEEGEEQGPSTKQGSPDWTVVEKT